MKTAPCTRFIYASLDNPFYYADICAKCGHFKEDHKPIVSGNQDANAERADATSRSAAQK
jgi:hypothetical protein